MHVQSILVITGRDRTGHRYLAHRTSVRPCRRSSSRRWSSVTLGNDHYVLGAPELFPLDDLGYSALEDADIEPGDEDRVRRAVVSCPERALSVREP